jgi:hypothetical protein
MFRSSPRCGETEASVEMIRATGSGQRMMCQNGAVSRQTKSAARNQVT